MIYVLRDVYFSFWWFICFGLLLGIFSAEIIALTCYRRISCSCLLLFGSVIFFSIWLLGLIFFWIIFFLLATGALAFLLANYVFPGTSTFQVSDNFWVNLVSYTKGMLVAATAVCSIRLFKYRHMKEKWNLELLKEKNEAQLQLFT